MIRFEINATDGNARAGIIHTNRGKFHTPVFMPVGTQGTVKAMTTEELRQAGAGIILANTYHLHIRPGEQIIRELGGLHRFMNWDGPILTDSGGYQVFSLAALGKVTEEGVNFRSHLDGAALFLTPESSVAIQEALGSDIIMAFDHFLGLPAEKTQLEEATARTTRWAGRCKEALQGDGSLFGIVQGGTDETLRRRSVEELVEIGFDGYAIGGLSVGEPPQQMYDVVSHTAPLLPREQPRYLMGAGEPVDLLTAIGEGVDMFDCVLPTRNARNGSLFTGKGKISIKQNRYREDPAPLDDSCACPTCSHYSRAYLRHLFMAREILAMRLNTFHNLHFFLNLMAQARQAIQSGAFQTFSKEFLAEYNQGDD